MMDEQSQGVVALLSGDLLFASKVKSAATNGGYEFYFGGNLPKENTASIRFVILDLSTRNGLVPTIAKQCADECPDARLIAYGPHVQVEKLKAAREAGIPRVLTNGQLDAGLSGLFS
ncbi:hypothetical protein Pla22_34450 [Rubripirellula amarantea]|uniref:Response regulatory domain-containing protein n=1 Tax=Rubripirellula amarantea TaxID=2527999 RepID=A0A5C5WLP9_9BACT|nr:histidine kinase [Rubripirellula amarantea]TWT50702.1 hypothetical protein Pla22_34450 [Rubripirellula amarantea]